jgi:hypothetical protein
LLGIKSSLLHKQLLAARSGYRTLARKLTHTSARLIFCFTVVLVVAVNLIWALVWLLRRTKSP